MKLMNKTIMIMLTIMALANFVSADCSYCNETCSPCGGGCNATDLSFMYAFLQNFDTVVGNISGWNTSCITNMAGMFSGIGLGVGSDFNQDISGWDVSHVTDMSYMFTDDIYFNRPLDSWDVSHVTTMTGMFQHARAFNQPLNSWNTSSVTDMSHMFECTYYPAYGHSVYNSHFNGDISSWDTSKVTDMGYMFQGAIDFNQSLNSWNTSQVTTTQNMFAGALYFNQPIGAWDTHNVTDMRGMFSSTPFNNDISGWDTSKVTYMNAMFASAYAFNQPLNSWDVSHVLQMMSMFAGASAFNQDLSSWNVSSVGYFNSMFENAASFDQNLSSWNTGGSISAWYMFRGAKLSTANYDSLLSGWSSKPQQSGVHFDGGNSTYSGSGLTGRTFLVSNYSWVITDGGPEPECVNDSDCGFCEYCSVGTCIYQDEGNDVKDDCSEGTGGWLCPGTINTPTDICTELSQGDNCNGAGECQQVMRGAPEGRLCQNQTPGSGPGACDVWTMCGAGQTNAPRYMVGCSGNIDGTCSFLDAQNLEENFTVNTGYQISVTENASWWELNNFTGDLPICQESLITVQRRGGSGFPPVEPPVFSVVPGPEEALLNFRGFFAQWGLVFEKLFSNPLEAFIIVGSIVDDYWLETLLLLVGLVVIIYFGREAIVKKKPKRRKRR
jgi:surface protein